MKGIYTTPTLCWRCVNAVPDGERGCSWSREFKPVDGWDAEPTLVRAKYGAFDHHKTGFIESFQVKACPEFEEG